MSRDTRRFLLRDRTADAHAALETAVGDIASRPAYARYLQGLHAFRAPAEQALAAAAWPAGFGAWRAGAIAAELAADLGDLGVPRAAPVPIAPPADAAAIAGLAYVLEGSALGARLISRRAEALGYGAGHGARHLARQVGGAGNWQAFIEVLDGIEALDMERAAAAANEGFAAAHLAFGGLHGRD